MHTGLGRDWDGDGRIATSEAWWRHFTHNTPYTFTVQDLRHSAVNFRTYTGVSWPRDLVHEPKT